MDILEEEGNFKASKWYWLHTIKSLTLYVGMQMKGQYMMIQSAIKIAIRNIKRHANFALINLVGFGVGLASCILIFMFVANELRYDRHHEKAERIYRMALDASLSGETIRDARTPSPMAFTLKNTFPEVEHVVRLFMNGVYVKYGDVQYKEDAFLYADSTVFDVFTIPLAVGDPETALTLPSGIVLTPETAQKYFGEKDAMGEILTLQDGTEYIVTGITEKLPETNHFQFDFLAAITSHNISRRNIWLANDLCTYFTLHKEANIEDFAAKIPDLEREHVGAIVELAMGMSYDEFLESGSRFGFFIQPLLDIHLRSDLGQDLGINGSMSNIYILSAIALIILLVASINFINLATAQSMKRANEVGIRKVMGSYRSQLIKQFLMESILQCILAFILAILLTALAHPHFENIIGQPIPLNILTTWYFIPGLLIGVVLIGIVAGSYPALVMASYQPIVVLQGKLHKGLKGRKFRNGLVVFQFAASISLLISALVIQQQIKYLRNKSLGFDKEQVLVIQNASAIGSHAEVFKNIILKDDGVINATYSNGLPLLGLSATILQKLGSDDPHNYTVIRLDVDYNFYDTYRLSLIDGRSFTQKRLTDSSAIILNETAVELLALDQPLGSKMIFAGTPETPLTAIGVYKDYHLRPLQEEMFPMVTTIMNTADINFMSIRLKPEQIVGTIDRISEYWSNVVPGQPMDYLFFDDQFDILYRTELKMGQLIISFTILALSVACLGLFGLVMLTTQMRTKEIGIRKVMGASVARILTLMTKEILIWVVVANIIAWPISFYLMQNWLNGFAYRIAMPYHLFLFAGFITLSVALVSIIQVAVKAANKRPVETLHYE